MRRVASACMLEAPYAGSEGLFGSGSGEFFESLVTWGWPIVSGPQPRGEFEGRQGGALAGAGRPQPARRQIQAPLAMTAPDRVRPAALERRGGLLERAAPGEGELGQQL